MDSLLCGLSTFCFFFFFKFSQKMPLSLSFCFKYSFTFAGLNPRGEQSGFWGLGRQVSLGGQTRAEPACPCAGASLGLRGSEWTCAAATDGAERGEDRAQTGLLLGRPGPCPKALNPSSPPLPAAGRLLLMPWTWPSADHHQFYRM